MFSIPVWLNRAGSHLWQMCPEKKNMYNRFTSFFCVRRIFGWLFEVFLLALLSQRFTQMTFGARFSFLYVFSSVFFLAAVGVGGACGWVLGTIPNTLDDSMRRRVCVCVSGDKNKLTIKLTGNISVSSSCPKWYVVQFAIPRTLCLVVKVICDVEYLFSKQFWTL